MFFSSSLTIFISQDALIFIKSNEIGKWLATFDFHQLLT